MMSPDNSLAFQQGDDTWKKLRKKSLTDLYFFNAVVLGMADKIPMNELTHRAMCRFAERRTGIPRIDTAPVQKIEVPRDVGKTTLVTQGRTLQRICADQEQTALLFNEKLENVQKFLSAIKDQICRNDLLRALFPEIVPPDLNKTRWNASEIQVPRQSMRPVPTVMTSGVGGAVAGMHPDHIIVDDMISEEAASNARTGKGQIIQDTNFWINTLDALLNQNAVPFPTLTFIGTRWWYGDSYEYVEKAFGYGEDKEEYLWTVKLGDGTKQQLTVYRVGDCAVFRRSAIEQGQSIFPQKWTLEALAKKRMRDPVLFAANYLNQPSDEVTAIFKSSWLNYFEWDDHWHWHYMDPSGQRKSLSPSDCDVLMMVDPGGFAGTYGRDRARAGIVVTATKDNLHFLLDAYCEPDSYQTAAQHVLDFARRYRVRKIGIERVGQQLAFIDLVKALVRQAGLQVAFEDLSPGLKDKDDRILELEPYFQDRRVYVARGAKMEEFLQQYQQFPRGRKDLLDALAYAPRMWKKPSMGASHLQRQEAELVRYRMRRGITTGYT